MAKPEKKLKNAQKITFLDVVKMTLNSIVILFDILLILLWVLLVCLTILLLIAIFYRNPCYIHFINKLLCVVSFKAKIDYIAAFGVFASVTFIPFVSVFITFFMSSKSIRDEISIALAKSKNISFYYVSLPYGAWNNLIIDYDNAINNYGWKELPISAYDYCLMLVFEGEYFQSYDIKLNEVIYNSSGPKNKGYKLREKKSAPYIPYFVSDTTGIDNELGSGTRLAVLFGNNENPAQNCTKHLKKYLFDSNGDHKNITLEFTMTQRKYGPWDTIKKMYGANCIRNFFPVIRALFNLSLSSVQKRVNYKIDMRFESTPKRINADNTKFILNIVDIDITTIKKNPIEVPKKKEVAKKAK